MDWEEFKSPFLKIEKGSQVDVVLSNPRKNMSDFGDKTKEQKVVADFDVTYLNGQVVQKGTMIFRTASKVLIYNELRPLFLKSNSGLIHIVIKRDANGRYALFEL